MNHLFIILPLLLVPIIGLTLVSRYIWTALLGLAAAMGTACARNQDKAGNANKEPQIDCYIVAVDPGLITDSRWQGFQEIEDWAKAERSLINASHEQGVTFEQIQAFITAADQSYRKAEAVVKKGALSKEVYKSTGDILSEWHRDLAMSHSNVECYAKVSIPPMVMDVNRSLLALDDLQSKGKLSAEATTQARKAVLERTKKDMTSKQAEELTSLLFQLLGY